MSIYRPLSKQECSRCEEYTGRCEEDSIYVATEHGVAGPLCEACAQFLEDTMDGIYVDKPEEEEEDE